LVGGTSYFVISRELSRGRQPFAFLPLTFFLL